MKLEVISDSGFSLAGDKTAVLENDSNTGLVEYCFSDAGGIFSYATTKTLALSESLTFLYHRSRQLLAFVRFNDSQNFTAEGAVNARNWPAKTLMDAEEGGLTCPVFLSACLEGKNPLQQQVISVDEIEGADEEYNLIRRWIALSEHYEDKYVFIFAQQAAFGEFYTIPTFGPHTVILFIDEIHIEIPYHEIRDVKADGNALTIVAAIRVGEALHGSVKVWLPTPQNAQQAANYIYSRSGTPTESSSTAPAVIDVGTAGSVCEVFVRGDALSSGKVRTRVAFSPDGVRFKIPIGGKTLDLEFSPEAFAQIQGTYLLLCQREWAAQISFDGLAEADLELIDKFVDAAWDESACGLHMFVSPNGPDVIVIENKAEARDVAVLSLDPTSFPIEMVSVKVHSAATAESLARFELMAGGHSVELYGSDNAVFEMQLELNFEALSIRKESPEKLLKVILGLEHRYWTYQSLGSIEEIHRRLQRLLTGNESPSARLPGPTAETVGGFFAALELLEWGYNTYLYTMPRRSRSITGLIGIGLDPSRHHALLDGYTLALERAFMRLKPVEAELRLLESRMRSTVMRANREVSSDHTGTYLAAASAVISLPVALMAGASRYFMEEDRRSKLTAAMVSDAVDGVEDVILGWNRLYQFSLGPVHGAFMSEVFAAGSRFWRALGAAAGEGTAERMTMEAWCARLMTFLAWPTSVDVTRGDLASALIKHLEEEPSLADSLIV